MKSDRSVGAKAPLWHPACQPGTELTYFIPLAEAARMIGRVAESIAAEACCMDSQRHATATGRN